MDKTSRFPRLGVAPDAAYAAGLAGALCDAATRARLAEIDERAYGLASSSVPAAR